MIRWTYLALALAIVALAAPVAHATNGMETLAWGARAAGMGGVDLAIATDTTAINTNPAGLAQLTGHRIDFGGSALFPTLHFKNDYNDEDGAFQVFPMPGFSYGYRFPNVPIALGIGMFAQGGMGADFELEHPVLGMQDYNSQLAYMKIAPAIAYQPHKMISIGAAFNFGIAMMGMKMPYSVKPSFMKGNGNQNGVDLNYGTLFEKMLGYDELTAMAELENAMAYGFGGKFGALFHPHERVSIGVAYTLETKLTFNGDATMDMTGQFDDAIPKMVDAFGLMPSVSNEDEAMQAIDSFFAASGIDPSKGMEAEYDAEIEFAWPQKVGMGIAYEPIDTVLLGVDVNWINWSATMKKFKMTMRNGTNDNINEMVGSEDVVAEIPLNWDDQVTVSVGGQYEFMPNTFGRLGYNYGKNPVPDDTVFPVFPAVVEHHITVGGGYIHNNFFSINAAYELALANTQEAADDHLVANEYDGSESTLGEHTVHVTASFDF
jgi:long-chain fatty acid transport protein